MNNRLVAISAKSFLVGVIVVMVSWVFAEGCKIVTFFRWERFGVERVEVVFEVRHFTATGQTVLMGAEWVRKCFLIQY